LPALRSFPTRRSSDLYQAAVDVGRREQLACVGGIYTSAIQYGDIQRGGLTILRRQLLADEGVHLLGLRSRGRLAGADGPNRLIRSEEHTSELQSRENL